MQFMVKTGKLAGIKSDCVVVGVFQGRKLSAAATEIDTASKGYLKAAIKDAGFEGNVGQAQLLVKVPGLGTSRVMLLGLGKEADLDSLTLQKAVKSAASQLVGTDIKH
ncbi:MAG: M17 family peptidase N-terminal domain-containing protein, partial [Gammaproteobacteria bacterium]|nr:M17 family peptidase N-terminal domain-containing protein [Gammaproteobacteria bacterium]